MKPVTFPESNIVAGKDQSFRDLPAWTDGNVLISCWGLTLRERLRLLFSGKVWISLLTFGEPVQGQLPQVQTPFRDGETGEGWLRDQEKADA